MTQPGTLSLEALATLSCLSTDTARRTSELHQGLATIRASWLPDNPSALTGVLANLVKLGLVAKTDTGGPVKTRKALWTLTDEGARVIAAWHRMHP